MIVTILPMDRKDEPALFVAMHKYDFVWFPPVKKKRFYPGVIDIFMLFLLSVK